MRNIVLVILIAAAAALLLWLFNTPTHRAWCDDQDDDY